MTTSVALYANDSIVVDTTVSDTISTITNVVKPITKSPIEWTYWIVMTIGIAILNILPRIKPIFNLLSTSKNTMIQRWISDTSEFMTYAHNGSLALSAILLILIPSFEGMVIADYLKNINVLLLGVASVTLFANKSK